MTMKKSTSIRPRRWSVALWCAVAALYTGFSVFTAATANPATGWDVLLIVLYVLVAILAAVTAATAAAERRWNRERARRNTGTWTGPDGQITTVRFDPGTREFSVTANLTEGWEIADQTWPDRATLTAYLVELETAGHVPTDDEGTRAVRARLMLPGWDRDPDEVTV